MVHQCGNLIVLGFVKLNPVWVSGFCSHQLAIFLYLKFYACCPSLQVYFSFTDHGIILLLLGLADHDNYHEYCRLLGRFRVNYQVIYCIIIFLKHNLLHVLYFVLLLCIFPCYWFSTHRLVCLDTLTCL